MVVRDAFKTMKGKKEKTNSQSSASVAAGGIAKQHAKQDEKKAKEFMNEIFGKAKSEKSSKTVTSVKDSPAAGGTKLPGKEASRPSSGKAGGGSVHDMFGKEAEARQKTEEGWNVYSEEELGLNKQGGDTALCPFDCKCCY